MLKVFMLNHLSCYINSLGDALSQMGNHLIFQSSWNAKEIEAGISHFQPDILLTVGFDSPMEGIVDALPELCEKYRLLHLYWATEDLIHYDSLSLPLIKRMKPDIAWTIHPACVDEYRKLGFHAEYVNFAFNPRMFPEKKAEGKESFNISFVGSTHLEKRTYRYESLKQLVVPLIESGQQLDVWGWGWKEYDSFVREEFGVSVPSRGYLAYKKTASVYRNSKIMLGVQNADDQVTQRTFEILGTGAFMIASRTSALSEMFAEDEELVLSSGPEETIEKVRYYLGRPDERNRIGRKARARVLQSHTFEHRLTEAWPALCELARQMKEEAL